MKYLKFGLAAMVLAAVGTAAVAIYFNIGQKEMLNPLPDTGTTITPVQLSRFSPEEAPLETLKGVVEQIEGDVEFLARTATEAGMIASAGGTIRQGESYMTGEDSGLEMVFADRCGVEMDENTQVDVVQTLPANIVFSQLSGAAKYTNSGSFPITIRTAWLLTQTDGEAEIIRDTDRQTVTVRVKSGTAVAAYNDLDYISHTREIPAGRTFTFNYGTRRGVLR